MDDRIKIDRSLYGVLLEEHPHLPVTRASKASLIAASHLVEELLAETDGASVLVSGFQHGGRWSVERDRYLALPDTRAVVVFAGEDPPGAWDVTHIPVRLAATDPLAQEWFVLALGPGVAVTLCGLDGDVPTDAGASAQNEGDRVFDTLWSFDPAVAVRAAAIVLDAIEEAAPDRAQAAREAVATAGLPTDTGAVAGIADRVLAGMLDRLEHQRRRERAADRRAAQATNSFLSRMSHELRNPLNAIIGFAQLLEGSTLDEQDADGVQRIRRAGRHLLALVDEVLDVTRIEAGALRLDLAPIRVSALVEDAWLLVQHDAAARSIRVDLAGALHTALEVRADRLAAVQVLTNLFSNAIKYDVEGGRLTVTARRSADLVMVAVTDTGPGLDEDDLERLFVPFERLSARGGPVEGTGLGLSLSKSLAEAMDGHLDVRSTPGAGSTFTLLLPRAAG